MLRILFSPLTVKEEIRGFFLFFFLWLHNMKQIFKCGVVGQAEIYRPRGGLESPAFVFD